MRFRLLGPVEIGPRDHPVRLAGARVTKMLAALLVDANRTVPVSRLVDVLWDDAPPASAIKVVRNCVSALRIATTAADLPATVTATANGYRLNVSPEELDVAAFYQALHAADRCGDNDPEKQAAAVSAALHLWRGPALAGLGSGRLRPTAVRLDEQRLLATERFAVLQLRLGRHHQLIGPLTELTGQYPLNEQLVGHLMVALYRTGRRADALEAYQGLRDRLRHDLGLEPSARIGELHTRVLRGDPALDAPGASVTTAAALAAEAAPPAVPHRAEPDPPRQLPAPSRHFAGRSTELEALTGLVELTRGAGASVVLAIVDGPAGVGKTALAVHWAHGVAEQFPDGQLYTDLHGFDPEATPADPAVVVRSFLSALGIPPAQVPTGLDAQAALYRSRMAGRRILLILDNASDATQVRPLLPGSPGCLAVITSRKKLTGLVVTEGAYPFTLDVFTAAEASDLLTRRLGAQRLAEEPLAASELVELCARLPLALCIVAARAAIQPRLPLSTLVGRLRDAGERLGALDGGDAASDVRSVFSWSYRSLSPSAARMLRLLGLHCGPDITVAAAASLGAVPASLAATALEELAGVNLLSEHVPGRYTWHDLIHAFAAAQAKRHEDEAEQATAVGRTLDHYLHNGHAAARWLEPAQSPVALPDPAPGVVMEDFADEAAANAWLAAERMVIFAAIDEATRVGADVHAAKLPWTLVGTLDRGGQWHDLIDLMDRALPAAGRLADAAAQARVHRALAYAHIQLGRYETAAHHLSGSARLCEHVGDQDGHGRALLGLASLTGRQHDPATAVDYCRQALAVFERAGSRAGKAKSLNALGWYRCEVGAPQAGLRDCQQALSIHRDLGYPFGEASTLDSLGYAYHLLGDHTTALDHYRQALDLYVGLDNRYYQAATLNHIGDTRQAAGQCDGARTAWTDALAILTELQHPEATQVREKLYGHRPG